MAPGSSVQSALLRRGLSWPLLGRDHELRCIAELRAERAGEGGGVGVVIAGPAGVGRSHLARHAVAAAEHAGAPVAWLTATASAATVPFGPVAGLLPEQTQAADPATVFRRTAALLREEAGGRTVVLGVDDAHLLDPASAALVLHLAVSGTAFVVATVRSGAGQPDAVRTLWNDAGAVRFDLGELTADETGRLAELVLAGPVEPEARRWLFDRSRGNPLYVRELLLGALADQALRQRDELWRLLRVPPPSPALAELVGARTAGLNAAERAVVELLAFGEPLRLSELTELAGSATTAAVEAHGMLAVDDATPDADVWLAHPVYGYVLRAEVPRVRASAITHRLAEALGNRRDRTPADTLRIARWLLDSGGEMPVEQLLEAAAAALEQGELDLAATFATRAQRGGGSAAAVMLLARARNAQGRGADAEALLAGIEGTSATPDAALEYLHLRLTVLTWGVGRDPAAALALIGRALRWWPDPGWAGRLAPLQARLAAIVDGRGEPPAAVAAARSGSAIDTFGEHVDLHHAFYRGAVREAHRLVMHRLPRVPLRGEAAEVAALVRCLTGLEGGEERAELTAWLLDAVPAAVRTTDHAAAGLMSATLGGLALAAGRQIDADRRLVDAVGHLERRDPFAMLGSVHALRAEARYRLGDRAGATLAADRARVAFGADRVPLTSLPYLARGRAWAAMAEGDPARGQRILLEAARRLTLLPLYAAQLHHEALRIGARPAPMVGTLTALRARCDAPLVDLYLRHVRARADGDAAALLRCADEFTRLDALRYAAECAAEAAEVLAEQGRTDSARRAATRSRYLHEQGQGGGPAPPIRGVDEAGLRLTRRESQVAELAADGLTNAQIGERLTISVRTVESHLHRAMQKRGARSRRELRGR